MNEVMKTQFKIEDNFLFKIEIENKLYINGLMLKIMEQLLQKLIFKLYTYVL